LDYGYGLRGIGYGYAMFRKQEKGEPARDNIQRLPSREVFCRICNKATTFSHVWKRISPQSYCMNCGYEFPDVDLVYMPFGPRCPQCEEPLEAAGFDYGLCDECSSKYELVPHTKPSWLPNQAQREKINQQGRSRNVLE